MMEKTKEKIKKREKKEITFPKLYSVLLHNDNQTPMDFVTKILTDIFEYDFNSACDKMLEIHEQEKGVVKVCPFEIAEMLVAQVDETTSSFGYPLKCTYEPN